MGTCDMTKWPADWLNCITCRDTKRLYIAAALLRHYLIWGAFVVLVMLKQFEVAASLYVVCHHASLHRHLTVSCVVLAACAIRGAGNTLGLPLETRLDFDSFYPQMAKHNKGSKRRELKQDNLNIAPAPAPHHEGVLSATPTLSTSVRPLGL